MKQTQKGKKKATNQKQAQNTEDISGFSFAMGEMDLIFTITFTDKDLEKPEGEGEDKYYKIEDMSSIKDLQFLKDKDEEFIGRIKMRPNNEFTKQLLLGNKISKKKCFIDFITFGRPKFEGEEEFFDTIFNQVTLKNGLQINSTPLEEGRFSLVIELKYKDKEQKIQLGTTPSVGITSPTFYSYLILMILIAGTTFFSFKMNTSTNQEDPTMKMMPTMMSVMIVITAIFMPTGLGIYWVTSNLFTIAQNILVKRSKVVHGKA